MKDACWTLQENQIDEDGVFSSGDSAFQVFYLQVRNTVRLLPVLGLADKRGGLGLQETLYCRAGGVSQSKFGNIKLPCQTCKRMLVSST